MEELNQVQDELVIDSNDDDNLFADFEESEAPEEPEQEETNEAGETETEEVQTSPFLNIKFNGEEKALSEEEARTLAQKGMNYDRFYEPIERLARLNGMSVGEYLNTLNDTQTQYEIQKEMDALREDQKYEGVSDEILEEIATSRVTEKISREDRQYQEQLQGEADAQQQKVERDIELFFTEYPEFRNKGPETLDPQVFEFVKQGYTLLEAYNKWARIQDEKNRPLEEAKAKVSRQNEENRKRSLGNTTNAGSADSDDFLNGFLEG